MKHRLIATLSVVGLMAGAIGCAHAKTADIMAGDVLSLAVLQPTSYSMSSSVDENGNIRLPKLGYIHVSGLSLEEVERKLVKHLKKQGLKDPEVFASVSSYTSRKIYVLGEVKGSSLNANNSVSLPVHEDITALQAVSSLGGFTEDADLSKVIVRRMTAEGEIELIPVPAQAIMNGEKAKDIVLKPTDMLIIPGRD